MPQESPRIAELRRRVHADPASIAFAQLAEEYRRAGEFQQAVKYCRNGLARHPGYLSARVTLGRALIELGELDDAAREFELVLRSAPDNLTAVRAMAEIQQRRGSLSSALDYYKRALSLARFDPELEESVVRIARELGTVTAPANSHLSFEEARAQLLVAGGRLPEAASSESDNTPAGPPSPSEAAESLIDFDALLASLGAPNAAPPPLMQMLLEGATEAVKPVDAIPSAMSTPPESGDVFAGLEHELRAYEQRPHVRHALEAAPAAAAPGPTRSGATRASEMIVQELESWLLALSTDRVATSSH